MANRKKVGVLQLSTATTWQIFALGLRGSSRVDTDASRGQSQSKRNGVSEGPPQWRQVGCHYEPIPLDGRFNRNDLCQAKYGDLHASCFTGRGMSCSLFREAIKVFLTFVVENVDVHIELRVTFFPGRMFFFHFGETLKFRHKLIKVEVVPRTCCRSVPKYSP